MVVGCTVNVPGTVPGTPILQTHRHTKFHIYIFGPKAMLSNAGLQGRTQDFLKGRAGAEIVLYSGQ